MDKNEMKMQREENYKKWFDRWIRKCGLTKQIEIANNKNYTRVNIPVHKVENERDKKMMLDDNFIDMLRKEFTNFEISREKEIIDRYLLGRKIGQIEENKVYICWS